MNLFRASWRLSVVCVVAIGMIVSAEETSNFLKDAETEFLEGNLPEALCLYSKLCIDNPNNWIYRYNAGLLYILTGDTLTGLTFLGEVINLRPKSPWPFYNTGQVAFIRGDDVNAALQFAQALKYDNNHLPSLTAYAECLAALGRYDEAIRCSRRAVDKYPLSADAKKVYAHCLNMGGRTEEAFEIIEDGIKQFPMNELLKLGILLSDEVGDSIRSESYRRLYSQIYPTYEYKNRLIDNTFTANFDTGFKRNDVEPPPRWLNTGVRYIYKGYWGPFRLGTLELEVCHPIDTLNMKCIPVNYRIKSNPILFFISVNDRYRAYLIPDQRRTLRYDMNVRETWWKYDRRSDMDAEKGVFTNRLIEENHLISIYEQELPANLFDGISILFFGRMMVKDKQSGRAPTLVGNNVDWTDFYFTGQREKIKAAGEWWDAWKAVGVMDNLGVAGMTGNINGWFSTDGQALPLRGSFKIFIGSIVLVLDNVEQL